MVSDPMPDASPLKVEVRNNTSEGSSPDSPFTRSQRESKDSPRSMALSPSLLIGAAARKSSSVVLKAVETSTGLDIDGDGKVQGKAKDELAVMCANDATTINFGEAAMAYALSNHQKRSQPFGPGAKCEQPIPWYIIDPTGRVIREARERESNSEKKLNGSLRWSSRLRLMSPTLYPMWDAVTGVALAFTGACGSLYHAPLLLALSANATIGVDPTSPRLSSSAALCTPFEVGFLPPAASPADPLFIVNRIVDIVFVLDMLFAFITMKQLSMDKAAQAAAKSKASKSELSKGVPAAWETDLSVLAYDYFITWFLIDIISIAPSVFDFLPSAFEARSSNTGASAGTNNGYRVLRTIRALRLIKVSAHEGTPSSMRSSLASSGWQQLTLRRSIPPPPAARAACQILSSSRAAQRVCLAVQHDANVHQPLLQGTAAHPLDSVPPDDYDYLFRHANLQLARNIRLLPDR